jgi:hypothetical protein
VAKANAPDVTLMTQAVGCPAEESPGVSLAPARQLVALHAAATKRPPDQELD